jgi:hypothetical protein
MPVIMPGNKPSIRHRCWNFPVFAGQTAGGKNADICSLDGTCTLGNKVYVENESMDTAGSAVKIIMNINHPYGTPVPPP